MHQGGIEPLAGRVMLAWQRQVTTRTLQQAASVAMLPAFKYSLSSFNPANFSASKPLCLDVPDPNGRYVARRSKFVLTQTEAYAGLGRTMRRFGACVSNTVIAHEHVRELASTGQPEQKTLTGDAGSNVHTCVMGHSKTTLSFIFGG